MVGKIGFGGAATAPDTPMAAPGLADAVCASDPAWASYAETQVVSLKTQHLLGSFWQRHIASELRAETQSALGQSHTI